jgi:hypothetical protein
VQPRKTVLTRSILLCMLPRLFFTLPVVWWGGVEV